MTTFSNKWMDHFKRHADAARDSSKDTTKVGACLIGEDNEVLLTAFNGPSIGVKDTVERRTERPMKYYFASHAERNLISFAARNGINTKGLTVYCTHVSCSGCANAMVQAGITCVISGMESNGTAKMPDDDFTTGTEILTDAGVQLIYHDRNSEMIDRADALCRAMFFEKKDILGKSMYYYYRRVFNQMPLGTQEHALAAALLVGLKMNDELSGVFTNRTIGTFGFDKRTHDILEIFEEAYTYGLPAEGADYIVRMKNPEALLLLAALNWADRDSDHLREMILKDMQVKYVIEESNLIWDIIRSGLSEPFMDKYEAERKWKGYRNNQMYQHFSHKDGHFYG